MDKELLKKLGNMDQLAAARALCITEGEAKGFGLIEIYNAAGLRFSVTTDRCLDLYDCSYKGINLSFHSKNGLNRSQNPVYEEFFEQWPGGMLSTCGLANVGAACEDNGSHPIHGRVSMTPAQHICIDESWENDAYTITVSGEIRETRLYGRNLALTRCISTTMNARTLTLTDTLTNYDTKDEEFMLLYHINFGYPLLDEGSECVSSHEKVLPRSDNCISHCSVCSPDTEPPHQQFLHTTSAPRARAAIINPALQIGCYIEYDTANLSYMQEWKHMASHDYVIALEPCNCIGLGRVEERKNGTLQVLPAYESITHSITIGILDGQDEIDEFRRLCER